MTYFRLNDIDLDIVKEAEEITFTDYEVLGEFIPVENLICIIADLIGEVVKAREDIQDIKDFYADKYDPQCL